MAIIEIFDVKLCLRREQVVNLALKQVGVFKNSLLSIVKRVMMRSSKSVHPVG